MKKSAVIMLALAAAIGAQGALVDWQYLITKQSESTVPSYMAYLIDAATWESMTVTSQADLHNAALDEAGFVLKDSSGKGTAKTYNFSTKDASNAAQARAVDVGEAASVDAYIVLFDSTKGYQASGKMTLTARKEDGTPDASGTISNTAATVSGGSWTVPVPEPTTVALLALGLAAAGLKRKVA